MKQQPVVFMFSGQGSHFYGMAAELYREDAVFRATLNRLAELASPYLEGMSLLQQIYQPENRQAPFERTLVTHPALYAIQYSLAKSLIAQGIQPDYLLGYSLGEYVALAVSEAISMEAGMEMILAQARALEQHAPAAGMIAILENAALIQADPYLFRDTWLAAVNYDKHFVLSGERQVLEELNEALFQRGIIAQVLAVSHGFHSSLVDPAKQGFEAHCKDICFETPRIPVYSAMRQELVSQISPEYLWLVCRNQVRFRETVRQIETQGSPLYVDLGPSGTLANFCKAILAQPARCVGTINQWGKDLQALELLKQKIMGEN